jgi:hypothetical protein
VNLTVYFPVAYIPGLTRRRLRCISDFKRAHSRVLRDSKVRGRNLVHCSKVDSDSLRDSCSTPGTREFSLQIGALSEVNLAGKRRQKGGKDALVNHSTQFTALSNSIRQETDFVANRSSSEIYLGREA